ncbi:MAG: RNA 2',3'-cyclic phosphodiesterase [Hyphomicrobiaceae bacterium]|nr:RNA 2',3'-cyclic phosphodiesterase [Hyphomicrobiaceae bacterium]
MPRWFTGLELPLQVRESLARLRQPLPGARWIEPRDLHLTLRFFGDIDTLTARELESFLEQIEADAFELTLTSLGAFGGNDPRTVWAGVAPCPQLTALAQANERAARMAGLQPEARNFQAHITLARLRNSDAPAVARYLQRHGGFRCGPIEIDKFVLFGSKPRTGGGPYSVEQVFPLRGFTWDEDDEHQDDQEGRAWKN